MIKKFGISIVATLLVLVAMFGIGNCMVADGQKDILVKNNIQSTNQHAYAICIVDYNETRYHNLDGVGFEIWLNNAVCNKEYLLVTIDENYQTMLVQKILENRPADVQDLGNFRTVEEGFSTADVLRRMNSKNGFVVRVIFKEN